MPKVLATDVAAEDVNNETDMLIFMDDTEETNSSNSDTSPLVVVVDQCTSTEEVVDQGKRLPYGLMVYYIFHGILDELPATAVYLILKNHFQVSPDKYSFFLCLDWIPWVMKPIFGFISDRYPIRGRRRMPYITLGIILNVFGWALLCSSALLNVSASAYIIVYFLNSLAFVMHETAVDSLLAELSRVESESDMGLLQSLHWTCDAAGSVLGTTVPIVAFWMECSARTVLMITTGVVASTLFVLPWMNEPKSSRASILSSPPNAPTSCSSLPLLEKEITACFSNSMLLRSLLFVFLVSSPPTSGDVFTYFQTDVLHFSPAFLSFSAVLSTAANFIAAYAYAAWLRKWNMRSIFRYSILFAMATGLANVVVVMRWNKVLGIPDQLFVIGDTVAQGIASEIIFMPVAVLATRLAPQGLEGTVYAICLSVLNLSWAISELTSGLLSKMFRVATPDHYENLPIQMLVVALLTLVPLAFLHCVPDLGGAAPDEEDENAGGGNNVVVRESVSDEDRQRDDASSADPQEQFLA